MKDPAFLFYYQDFLVGTAFMSNEEVGAYIRVMAHLADKNTLTIDHILKICANETIADTIMNKLQLDENGEYYSPRLRIEVNKRKKHSEHQKNNILKRWNANGIYQTDTKLIPNEYQKNKNGISLVIPLENENENENNSLKEEDSKGETKNPTETEVLEYGIAIELPEEEAKKFYLIYESQGWKTAGEHPRRFNWRAKMKLYKLELARKARDETTAPVNKNNGKTLESILQART